MKKCEVDAIVKTLLESKREYTRKEIYELYGKTSKDHAERIWFRYKYLLTQKEETL